MNTRSQDSAGVTAGRAPSPAQARRNRLVLLMILLSFVAPFVIGHVAYFQGWFKGTATTNKGDLIDPPVAFADLHLQGADGQPLSPAFLDQHWRLVYVLPPQCEAACRNSLFQMRQVRRAAGQYADRVKLLLVQPQAPDAGTVTLLNQQFAEMQRVNGAAPTLDQALAVATPAASRAGRLYIMDAKGYIMLSYAPEADEKTSMVKAGDVLADLKKLLKDAEIG
jgi:cytochrome oxidase Cu insertion factor (SCO1/SenC/PrrC family)